MESRPKSSSKLATGAEIGLCALLMGVAAVFLLRAAEAEARLAGIESTVSVPCAVLMSVSGQVDLLDSSRSQLLPSAKHSAIPCGGWISIGKGAAEIHHRDGFVVHAGAGAFVQIPEPNVDGKNGGDHVIVFKGQVFAQAAALASVGDGELRVITANARARIHRGSAIVVYSKEDEETQLIALDSDSSLENRFESSRKVAVRPGEATSLNFKQLRVVPSHARAVAVSALRPKFDDLRIPARDRQAALHSTHSRQERVFASTLVTAKAGDSDQVKAREQEHQDARAHELAESASPGQDVRERLKKAAHERPKSYGHHTDPEQAKAVRKQWVGRLVAGEKGADDIVAPRELPGRAPASIGKASAGPVAGPVNARRLTPEDEEKLKLIDELSRIRDDDY